MDHLWYRPGTDALALAEARYRAELRKTEASRAQFDRNLAMESYLLWDTNEGDWVEHYRTRDPLELLQSRWNESKGLRRTDLRLLDRLPGQRLERTRYFMNVRGSFPRALEFLKSLEQASPLITVDSFVMEERTGASDLEFRLNLSVITAREGGA